MVNEIDLQTIPPSRFWMRSVSFLGLRNIVALLLDYPSGLSVKEITDLVKTRRLIRVKDYQEPSDTTIYHYRNTLIHLGIIERKQNRIQITSHNPEVLRLLGVLSDETNLTNEEKKIFSQLVINQKDCKFFFSDLFYPDTNKNYYVLDDWIISSIPVTWNEIKPREKRIVKLQPWGSKGEMRLSTENQIQSILYGVRYWFRDELGMIDEIFREDKGNIMFSVFPENHINEKIIISKLMEIIEFENEWARVSIRDIALDMCVKLHITLKSFYNIIRLLHYRYPEYVLQIPTSLSFATLTASTALRENLELRSYFRDDSGVYISHLRIHQRIKEQLL